MGIYYKKIGQFGKKYLKFINSTQTIHSSVEIPISKQVNFFVNINWIDELPQIVSMF
jgi:hypothetical protein